MWGQSLLVYFFLAASCWVMFDAALLPPSAAGEGEGEEECGGDGCWLERVQVQVRPGLDVQGWVSLLGIAGFGECCAVDEALAD